MSIQKFKTHTAIEREKKQAEMVLLLQKTLERAERGELSGLAVSTCGINGAVTNEWRGWNGHGLGHAISCLFHRYFRAQTST